MTNIQNKSQKIGINHTQAKVSNSHELTLTQPRSSNNNNNNSEKNITQSSLHDTADMKEPQKNRRQYRTKLHTETHTEHLCDNNWIVSNVMHVMLCAKKNHPIGWLVLCTLKRRMHRIQFSFHVGLGLGLGFYLSIN